MIKDLEENFVICRVLEDSADILTKIHEECFPRYWNRDAFTDFFAVSGTLAFLVEERDMLGKEKNPVAMVIYRTAFEQADIITIAVRPNWRRKNISRFMMEKVLSDCKQKEVKKIFLDVEEGNIPAIKLYESIGFKYISRRKLYYQQPNGTFTDALVMEKKL